MLYRDITSALIGLINLSSEIAKPMFPLKEIDYNNFDVLPISFILTCSWFYQKKPMLLHVEHQHYQHMVSIQDDHRTNNIASPCLLFNIIV